MLFTGAYIITVDDRDTVIPDGSIVVQDDRIIAIGPTAELAAKYGVEHDTIDLQGQIVVPGLVQAHYHCCQSILRGCADDHNLQEWLCDNIWPLEGSLQGDDGYWAAKLSIAELLRSGTTCFLDPMVTSQADFGRIVDACVETGIRACLAKLTKPQNIGRSGQIVHDNRDNAVSEMSAAKTVDAHARHNGSGDGRVHVWFGAVTPRSDIREAHAEMAELARKNNMRVTMHCAEAPSDRTFYTETFGQTPMEYCRATGLAGPNFVLGHMVHACDKDIDLIVETRSHVAHNPSSNCKLGSGVAPIPKMLSSGVNVALGTDGAPCSNSIDLIQEMRLASLLHRGHETNAHIMDAYTVLKMATINGARALGLDGEIGSLQVGKKADFISVRQDTLYGAPNRNPLSTLVFASTGREVDTVVVDGRVLLRHGVHTSMDVGEVMRMAGEHAQKLYERCGR